MFRTVIFDMDGVIVDSEPLHIQAERETLAPFDISISNEAFQAYMGQTPQILLADIIDKYDLDTTLEELYPRHEKNLLRLYRQEVTPIRGSLELISDLYKADLTLALASSSAVPLIDAVLNKFHLEEYFTAVVSGQEVLKAKPSPDIFLLTASRLKTEPSFCLVIEDSTAGIAAAKSAGMACIGFRSPNSRNQDYSRADLSVDSMEDLDLHRIQALYRHLN